METQDRILAITEEMTRHKIKLQTKQHDDSVELTKTELNNNADIIGRGQWFAFVAVVGITAGGFYMIHLGHDSVGIAMLITEVVGVASVFVLQLWSARGRGSMSESLRNYRQPEKGA